MSMHVLPQKGTCMCKTICKSLRSPHPPCWLWWFEHFNPIWNIFFKMEPLGFWNKMTKERRKAAFTRNKGNTARSNRVLIIMSHVTWQYLYSKHLAATAFKVQVIDRWQSVKHCPVRLSWLIVCRCYTILSNFIILIFFHFKLLL